MMQKALSLAKKAKGFTSPNPCVGAVIVKNNKIVGKGYHKKAGCDHAEIMAICDAGKNAKGSTLFVSLEPCNHFGKTPACTDKIIKAKIKKVVIGCKDPNPYVKGKGIKYLRSKGIKVVKGVCKKEAKLLIEDFIFYVKNNKKPFVILKLAATLDGKTATKTGDSKWITNKKSRAFAHKIRHMSDAVLIGANTLKKDNPLLTSRIKGMETKDPIRIVLDTNLSIKENSKVLNNDSSAKTIIVIGPDVDKQKKQKFVGKADIIEVPLKKGKLDLNALMIKLKERSIISLMIEGGSKVAGSALRQGIVNKICFFFAPKLLGSNSGFPMFEGETIEFIKNAFKLKRIYVTMFGNDLCVQGYLAGGS